MKAHYEGLPVKEFEEIAYYRENDKWWRCSDSYAALATAAINLEFFYQKELEEKVVKINTRHKNRKPLEEALREVA